MHNLKANTALEQQMIAEETEKIATPGVLLHKDKMDGIRIGQTKVLLDWIVEAYNKGDSPEQIKERFPYSN
jgi:hypothetical protein